MSSDSIASTARAPASMSELDDCDPATWLSERECGRTKMLLEQVLGQAREFSMVFLHAQLSDPEDSDR